jgi:hypothetical protein
MPKFLLDRSRGEVGGGGRQHFRTTMLRTLLPLTRQKKRNKTRDCVRNDSNCVFTAACRHGAKACQLPASYCSSLDIRTAHLFVSSLTIAGCVFDLIDFKPFNTAQWLLNVPPALTLHISMLSSVLGAFCSCTLQFVAGQQKTSILSREYSLSLFPGEDNEKLNTHDTTPSTVCS